MVADERLLGWIRDLQAADCYAHGGRRMWLALRLAHEPAPGVACDEDTRNLVRAKRRGKPRRTAKPDPEGQRRPDLVQLDFHVEARRLLWVVGLT